MIYLRTGSNGSCKTLFTLADVRKLQLDTGRPVCINARFKIKPEKLLEFGWKVIEFKDWQAEPDGTIFMIDECHNDLPVRPTASKVPDEIRMLAEHRSRGFDFYFLTQHPMNIDSFVRKLIGAPGWHQHLKRVFGGTNVTRVLQWDAVRSDCEKDGSGKTAQITTRGQPKEVYDWYDSASLHTAKVRIPKQLYILGACLLAIPAMIYLATNQIKTKMMGKEVEAKPAIVGMAGGGPASAPAHVMTQAEYIASFTPRVAGLPQTAPRYDEVTKPTDAPYPAACVKMGDRCSCYTQQGTQLQTPADLCQQIVKGGYFMDWQPLASKTAPVATQTPAPSLPSYPLQNVHRSGTTIADGQMLASMRSNTNNN